MVYIVSSLNYCSAALRNLSLLRMCNAWPSLVLWIHNDLSTEKLHYNIATLATIHYFFLICTVGYFTFLLESDMDVFLS